VNDAKSWAALLIDHFGFEPANVTMLLDSQATKKRVLAEVDRLLKGAKKGDVLVFTNSSHGTYVADANGDETRYDEAMCPYDMKKNLIVDDELRQRFTKLPDGVRLTVISDSCFSGSVTSTRARSGCARSTACAIGPSRGATSYTPNAGCARCSFRGAATTSTRTTPASTARTTGR
jgi:hypothetical protein